MNLGFWVHLFAPKQFREGGQCLHQIYLYRPKGVSPRELFNDLLFILNFRNRIAHHESICFSKQKEFSTTITRVIISEPKTDIVYIDETTFHLWMSPPRVWIKPGMRVELPDQ